MDSVAVPPASALPPHPSIPSYCTTFAPCPIGSPLRTRRSGSAALDIKSPRDAPHSMPRRNARIPRFLYCRYGLYHIPIALPSALHLPSNTHAIRTPHIAAIFLCPRC
ncbi:hypothetical protein DFH09DRAFT_1319131 [Mycena vulgaris]|nr:hypothetical protein DFH09DRAFT_1319131 [Mycena vulgaris]